MNTKKFTTMLFLCVIGLTGCNKIGNPNYMDESGDKISKKGKKRQNIGKSSEDSIPGTSSTEREKTSRNLAKDSSFFAEQSFLMAQKKVDRARESLKNAQHIKDNTSRNVELQCTRNSDRNIETMERLCSIAKKSDDTAEKNLSFAKEKLRRAEENLERMRINIRK